ncbi:16S rRNA (guanine(966)-N(2))-methyltransferase RsmD [Ethanoligenens harbinense]|uniref:Methyltransferase n=1 Tax=Ethanoligenens harbinense (strain DSM 18485 / JCM 12961 / CGMCC 1.5033 / YUAN-3) TaxID=663278 RepID=E6U3H9_ETHHY|nr:16S rRNA (guanine(966)-N(2))-methyltransferase RsmD [Ethanoligenens harbinense]ADU27579.1 methyltransferase [Ethanoligenens harbinense YUAN-3]AVQ96625.1 16S rRNA (guanine(966)-N(2))-methyltransferase RsmD [Ethanoligenens harbinense YUAN-3]AYF39286.1 16S rRNA (guanine(966)-N(2))-methyltransferase RsmD [Ethanoligenens harbinense]AYF42110.1 16S rRNA (guanine(966)-N(2))-methyltransferase RsmD [Ethanoligenens harbinense]QCN92865.1 16S rRNA (guanine(966)-N(2))-methyltransferase RsmD [Ethanoligene
MRVITGSARGARLETLSGLETRPTAERVKEALFSSIQFELEGRRVLDLFAGSGQLGIESLSRGAALAVFVDQSADAVKIIKANLTHTRLFEKARVLETEAELFLARAPETYDVIFLDPPYHHGFLEKLLPHAAAHLSAHGVLVAEGAKDDSMPEAVGDLRLVQKKSYGKTAIGFYRGKDVDVSCH